MLPNTTSSSSSGKNLPQGFLWSVLFLLTLTGSLINSKLFNNSSLTAFYLFTAGCLTLSIVAGIILLAKSKEIQLHTSLHVILFLLWITYLLIHGSLTSGGVYFRHVYLFEGCFLFFSLYIFLSQKMLNLRLIYTGVIILAVLESMICLFQYAGWIGSTNSYFEVTGTWVNPNVTAMFLTMALPAFFAIIFQNIRKKEEVHRLQIVQVSKDSLLATISILLVFLALWVLKCRTAFIGATIATAFMLNKRFGLWLWLVDKRNRFKSMLLSLLFTALVVFCAFYAYNTKKASANGRLLIWKLALQMVAQKPITGYGYGMFDRNYNLEQATYFESGKATAEEIANASYVRMGYNEFLENTVEGGLIGLVVFGALLVSLLFATLRISKEKKGLRKGEDSIHALAGILAFVVMSLFNFTVQAIPVLCLFVLYAALLAQEDSECKKFHFSFAILRSPWWKMTFSAALLVSSIYLGKSQATLAIANRQSKKAVDLAREGKIHEALQILHGLKSILKYHNTYLQNYGAILASQKQYARAVEQYNKAKAFTSNPELFLQTGMCYEALGKYVEAEREFTVAKNIDPSRFAPNYALMKLFQKMGNIEKAAKVAEEIIVLRPKKPSQKVDRYKAEAAEMKKEFASSLVHEF
jgi:O-antigen polymerase